MNYIYPGWSCLISLDDLCLIFHMVNMIWWWSELFCIKFDWNCILINCIYFSLCELDELYQFIPLMNCSGWSSLWTWWALSIYSIDELFWMIHFVNLMSCIYLFHWWTVLHDLYFTTWQVKLHLVNYRLSLIMLTLMFVFCLFPLSYT